jgi:hypothetical protein
MANHINHNKLQRFLLFREQIAKALAILHPTVKFINFEPENISVEGMAPELTFFSPALGTAVVPEDFYCLDHFDNEIPRFYYRIQAARAQYCSENKINLIIVPKMLFNSDSHSARGQAGLIRFLRGSGLRNSRG